MNENEVYVVKQYKFDYPLFTEIDSMIDSCFEGCHNNYFRKFKYECIQDIKLTNITNNEIINLTISGKSMSLYDLNKKLTVARQNGFLFNLINKLIIKIYSRQRFINISYYRKFQIPMCHRQFFRVISQNRECVDNFCNDMDNPFHLTCQKWFNQINWKLHVNL